MTRVGRRLLVLVLVLASVATGLASQAAARGGGDGNEVRVAGVCGKGATSNLRLRQRGDIDVRFQVEHTRSGQSWRVTLVRERRVVWRGQSRTRAGSFEIERRIPDLSGADQVTARAVGPRGLTCTASATLRGS